MSKSKHRLTISDSFVEDSRPIDADRLKSAMKASSTAKVDDEKGLDDILPATRAMSTTNRIAFLEKTAIGIIFQIIMVVFSLLYSIHVRIDLLNLPPLENSSEHIKFRNWPDTGIGYIKSVGQIYKFLTEVVIPSYKKLPVMLPAQQITEKSGLFMMIGKIRLSQHRTDKYPCKTFDGKDINCYSDFSLFHRSSADFGHNSPFRFVDSDEVPQSGFRGGSGTFYPPRGFHVDISIHDREDMFALSQLQQNEWIDAGTRIFSIHIILYNTNHNTITSGRDDFEILPDGNIMSDFVAFTETLMQSPKSKVYDDALFSILSITIFINLLIIFREVLHFGWKGFIKVWNMLDMCITFLHVYIIIIYFEIENVRKEALEQFKEESNFFHAQADIFCNLSNDYKIFIVLESYCICVRTFQYMNFNITMGYFNETIKVCAIPLVCFGVIYVYIFAIFMLLAVVIFYDSAEFSSLDNAFTSLYIISYGMIQVDDKKSTRFSHSFFFILFVMVLIYFIQQFFLCIICTAYADVKTTFRSFTEERQLQMVDYLKSKMIGFLRILGFKLKKSKLRKQSPRHINLYKILKRLNFSRLDIIMFFAKYNIPPEAQIAEYDEEELEQFIENSAKFRSLEQELQDTLITRMDKTQFIKEGYRLVYIKKLVNYLNNKLDQIIKRIPE